MLSMVNLRQVSLLLPVMLGVTTLALGADTDWRDVESRVQYAWYTEDARELTSVENRVRELPDSDPKRSYYLTLIQMREAQIAADMATVGRAAGGCVDSADAALAIRPTDAEVLALQSFCMDLRSRSRPLDVPFAGSRSRGQMQHALQLAPGNPRVRLLAAQLAYAATKSAAEHAKQLKSFQSAVDAFETERQGLERIPSWGAAEAWQGLAQVYLDRGDAIAARSALEHALLLMPDYKSAHRLLNHIVTG
jgi:tetratricopeptide (TPR) repeat protein